MRPWTPVLTITHPKQLIGKAGWQGQEVPARTALRINKTKEAIRIKVRHEGPLKAMLMLGKELVVALASDQFYVSASVTTPIRLHDTAALPPRYADGLCSVINGTHAKNGVRMESRIAVWQAEVPQSHTPEATCNLSVEYNQDAQYREALLRRRCRRPCTTNTRPSPRSFRTLRPNPAPERSDERREQTLAQPQAPGKSHSKTNRKTAPRQRVPRDEEKLEVAAVGMATGQDRTLGGERWK